MSASGAWQQTSGSGSNDSHTWQTSSQWGTYSHVVNGVTLAGTFSQSGSVDDRSHFSSSGSASSNGQWIPSGSGSDTLVTSASDSFSGSGNATGTLTPTSGVSWVSTGTQTEEESASASANHTTYFSLLPAGSSGAASGVYTWQATSGSGSTWGGQSTFGQYSGGGQYTAYSGGYAGGGSIQGTFSQAQSNTQSWNFNTKDAYQPATSTSPGYWQASSTGSSGTTVDSGGSSFYYSGGGVYGGSQGAPTGTLSQSGSGSETFSYTKNYGVDSSGNWYAASGSGGGASGSGWTYSSYDGTIPFAPTLPAAVVSATGYSSALSGTDQQSGSNNTSYNFQTAAFFNGIDWSETGEKTSSGSGGTSDVLSAEASSLTFTTPFGSASGSASMSGQSTTSYSYHEQAFLDGNGTWQNLFSASAGAGGASGCGSGTFTASGSTSWSLSGSGGYNTTSLYGNAASGSMSVSGSGSDSYSYTENFTFTPSGQWLAASGAGSSSGSGSVTAGYSASGGYSALDPAMSAPYGTAPGTAEIAANLANDWSGSVSASGSATQSYGYSTTSNYSPASGWVTTGNASATSTGLASCSFSGSTPFTTTGGQFGSVSGTASGSGSASSSYSYTETETMSSAHGASPRARAARRAA